MYQLSSSSKTHKQKSSPAWPKAKENIMKKQQQQLQHKRRCRNPFQDLNNGGSDSSSNASSVSSTEAPTGCLRFFLSHTTTSSKTHCTNSDKSQGTIRAKLVSSPKSAPSMRPAKENSTKKFIFHRPTLQKLEKVHKHPPKFDRNPSLSNVSSSKIPSALNSNGATENELKSNSKELKQEVVDRLSDFDGSNVTPSSKVVSVSGLNLAIDSQVINEDDENSNINFNTNTNSTSSNSKTPPVQASVSPEMLCGSSMVTTTAKTITPVCYGAGFVNSWVIDKRKCRPRGILTVGEAKPLDCFDSDDENKRDNDLGLTDNSSISVLPLPCEASMHWLLSPCNEEDEDPKENSENKLCIISRLEDCALPSIENGIFSSNSFDSSTEKFIPTSNSRKVGLFSGLLSPSRAFMGPPLYDKAAILCSEEERKNCSGLAEENSPFSIDSLGSGNVIQTPQSDSTSERKGGKSWLTLDGHGKNHKFNVELDSISENIQMAKLSPKSHVSIWDPTSPSVRFDCLTTPPNSVDLSHFQKVLDDRSSWFSNSTMENVSQSQMRISWREGLVSRIFEMDEFDSCRCLSEGDDDANICNFNCLNSHCSPELNVNVASEPMSINGSGSTICVKSEQGSERKVKEALPRQVPCSCVESMSTDGCGLVRSEDSDWTVCYKNNLFQYR